MAPVWTKRLDEEVETLRQARDELRVQLHLGAAEARDLWTQLEQEWEHLEAKLKQVGHATQDAAEDLEAAAEILLGEIKAGYQRVRDVL